MSKEREIQQRLILLEQLREQAEALQRRLVEIELFKSELERTIESLEFFEKSEGKTEALMNLGGGVFAYVDIVEKKKFLVDVGSGIVIEKELREAIDFLNRKKENMEKTRAEIEEAIRSIASRMESLQREIAELSKEAEK
ncbi:prefoldin, alpha subunit [Ferroglobus placidus DSM 10642]|uniref:Prefoldin subunit alpha n=1 Tax=Ferroglobus placidus (strain DSM 10642 / AEDII12DO) TaxID=589924 RepID=D3S0Y3_FERPA|nr:prefoldin subunit alpha [Ferroglobus placidus]ADC64219.1 prefoldin, alpha subunit [Ferroglobus placidus DSM 10642]